MAKHWFFPLIFIIVALINFAAGIYSIINYYSTQLSLLPYWQWFFVADCPVYAFVFGLALFLLVIKKPSPFLSIIAIVGVLKYSIWTIFVLLLAQNFFSYAFFIGVHALFILETIFLFRVFNFKVKHFLIALIWFLVNDVLDYILFLHPPFDVSYFVLVAGFSVLLSILLTIFVSAFFSARSFDFVVSSKKRMSSSKWAKK